MTNDSTPNGQRDARVQVLTAEVRTLMVGSRQVTLSVYNQLDEVQPEDMQPFGRVRPKGGDEYIWLVGRQRRVGTLVKAKLPASHEAIARTTGFDEDLYNSLRAQADAELKSAARYDAHPQSLYSGGRWSGTGKELAARCRELAQQRRTDAKAMLDVHQHEREPLWLAAEAAEELPLIVLAGLR